MLRVHPRACRSTSFFAVEHERQRLIVHRDLLGGVFGARPGVRDDGGHPLARIARHVDGERPARDLGDIETGQQRLRRTGELAPIQHVMHARHRECSRLVDGENARGGIWRRDQGDVPRAGKHDIAGEPAFARDKAAILAHAPVGGDETKGFRAHVCLAGWLRPRMRSAASAMASTICA